VIDLQNIFFNAAANSIFWGIGWLFVQRRVEKSDRRTEKLEEDYKNLYEHRVIQIENKQDGEGVKRKAIYERIERLEVDQVSRSEFINAVLKLEHISTETNRLVKWLDEVFKEQISLGKDLSELKKGIAILEQNRT
jgi:uncharacterized protein (UPF0335 family)